MHNTLESEVIDNIFALEALHEVTEKPKVGELHKEGTVKETPNPQATTSDYRVGTETTSRSPPMRFLG